MKTILKKTALLLFVCSLQFAYALPNHTEKPEQETIRIALLLDTSNSMDGLINQAKAQLWEIVNELSNAKYGIKRPPLKIALYEYGNASLPASEGYIRQVLQFSSDLDEISEKLFSLTTNGGSEFCGEVIATSLKELDWGKNKNDLRLIFIAGNEPFTQGKIDYREAISIAKEKEVLVNTIFCGNYTTGVSGKWQDGALLGGGDYMTINHNKKVVHIVTPYDDDIIILNKKLNGTYIYYGYEGKRKHAAQKKIDEEAEVMNEVVMVKRTMSKASRLYNNSSWDMVDADRLGKLDYSTLNRKNLPEALKNKSVKELKLYVKQQAQERAKIKAEIKELNKKRNQFIAKKQLNSTKDELESVIIKAIKKQALSKNYEW